MTAGIAECFHCLQSGHWQSDCKLLIPAANRKEHEARIAEYTRRFLYDSLPPHEKQRMIRTENEQWKKETAKK